MTDATTQAGQELPPQLLALIDDFKLAHRSQGDKPWRDLVAGIQDYARAALARRDAAAVPGLRNDIVLISV